MGDGGMGYLQILSVAVFFRGHLKKGTNFFGWGDPKNMQMYSDVGGISLIKISNSFLITPESFLFKMGTTPGNESISQGKRLKSWSKYWMGIWTRSQQNSLCIGNCRAPKPVTSRGL